MCVYMRFGFPFSEPCMNNLYVSYIPLFRTSELVTDEHG